MDTAQHLIHLYGYWAVFIWTFIEGETALIAAAALAAAGLMEPWKVIAAGAGGAFVGHLVYFAIGRWRGMQIIRAVPFPYPVAPLILSHHERWDGTGYPDKLAGEEIPLEARIITACDAYNAMTTTRPYRTAMDAASAAVELARCAGSQFDPDVVWDVCVDIFNRYNGEYSDEMKPFVEFMAKNRVVVRLDVDRTRSWDHRKLGMPAMELGGSTAPFVD